MESKNQWLESINCWLIWSFIFLNNTEWNQKINGWNESIVDWFGCTERVDLIESNQSNSLMSVYRCSIYKWYKSTNQSLIDLVVRYELTGLNQSNQLMSIDVVSINGVNQSIVDWWLIRSYVRHELTWLNQSNQLMSVVRVHWIE